MALLRTILKITAWVLAGIFLLYLFLSLVVIPLAAPWVVKSQASKLLKRSVTVRSVQFNPFLWRLTVKGLAIAGPGKQVVVGFGRFQCDFSFTGLLKKIYRVESLELDGLEVNAELSRDGKINLLELVPAPAGQPAAPAAGKPAEQPLPAVVVELISMRDGRVRFTDYSVNPAFTTTISGIDLRVTGLSTDPGAQVSVSCRARLDDKGTISTDALIKPFAVPLDFEMEFKLDDYALTVLTPYAGKYTGRTVREGKLSLNMDYRAANNKLTAGHRLRVQRFDFGDKVESKDALNLPFGLALALLEDTQDRIDISLPVTGDMGKPDFQYVHLIGQFARNFFLNLVTKPFSFLASMAGMESGSEEMGYVRFLSGKSELSEAEKVKLSALAKVLKERSRLYLAIQGSYDPAMDWKVIKEDVFNHDFQVLRAESKSRESLVYQTLYQRRFGIQSLWQLTKSYRSKAGVYDDAKINQEIKRRLIEDGAPDKAALESLAGRRAKVIYDFIIAAGFDPKRASVGGVRETTGSLGVVPLELVLTVFDDSPAAAVSE